MKKLLKYCGIILLSLTFTIFSEDNITNNAELVIQILLTLLGLCITSYTFVCTPISEAVSKNKNLNKSAINLINKLEEDMKVVFYITLIIIISTIMKNIDFILVKNPCGINFGIFVIRSFKHFLFNTIISACFILGLAGFYDFIVASFKITKGLVFMNKDN